METARFEVLPFSQQHMRASMANENISAELLESAQKIRYLSDYLTAVGAQSLVIELDYIDGDYLDDFSNYYVKCFKSYDRKCKRLHFFSSILTEASFRSLITDSTKSAALRDLQQSYLGFIVARPLPNAVVGRTVLKTYPSDAGRRNYPSTRQYKASLFGIDLSVMSLVFQEQDNVLAACATVALWCSFHKTADLFGTAVPTPAQITSAANRVVNYARPIPSHGLNIQQMCNAIRSVGLDAEVTVVNEQVPVVSLAYGHLKFGLPVILIATIEGTGLHAIALNGYSLNNATVSACEVDPKGHCIPMTGLRINEFYGHDDQIGPFCRVIVKPSAQANSKTYPVVFESSWKDPKTGKALTLFPEMIVVPVYHKIRVTFVDVQKWLTKLDALLSILLKGIPNLEWDLHLTSVNEYKRQLRQQSTPSEALLFMRLPKYMWRATLSTGSTLLFECMVDATDMTESAPFNVMLWHNDSLKSNLHQTLCEASLKDVLDMTLTPRFAALLKSSTT